MLLKVNSFEDFFNLLCFVLSVVFLLIVCGLAYFANLVTVSIIFLMVAFVGFKAAAFEASMKEHLQAALFIGIFAFAGCWFGNDRLWKESIAVMSSSSCSYIVGVIAAEMMIHCKCAEQMRVGRFE